MAFITLAGGCFWCMAPPFENLKGIKKIISGYANSKFPNPSYEQVLKGKTKAFEAVQIEYDEDLISYEEVLDIFWKQIDPTDNEGQFADKGEQYKTAIFYNNEIERKKAEKSKEEIKKYFDKPIATKILKFENFYPAEEYHQDYHKKNPIPYNMYKIGSGRAGFLREKWK